MNPPPERSPAAQAVVDALKAFVEQANDLDPSVLYAEGTGEYLRKQWVEMYGLEEAEGATCVMRLLGVECGGFSQPCECRPPGTDHPSLWCRDGRPAIYVSQPYSLGIETLRKINEFCDRWGLDYLVDSRPAFHFPAGILFVTFTRREEPVVPVAIV